ncbi:hypothetical protein LG198_03475 [Methylobacillus arboreus]|uniref:hypothetical protein n=1 Tax=Methylobacillus arboreus TaxID=755170 RepID=UPI001E3F3346|nr:hypothetical protein [Methylobacillus arboreus]MCB5189792.1 hypothetical protein [Methylobacillus arboreus]
MLDSITNIYNPDTENIIPALIAGCFSLISAEGLHTRLGNISLYATVKDSQREILGRSANKAGAALAKLELIVTNETAKLISDFNDHMLETMTEVMRIRFFNGDPVEPMKYVLTRLPSAREQSNNLQVALRKELENNNIPAFNYEEFLKIREASDARSLEVIKSILNWPNEK